MFKTLVSVSDLAAHLDDPKWVICDCRHDLMDYEKGRRAYIESHIPGARFVHLDEDLSGPKTGTNGRHPLPHPRTFALRLGALGIDSSTQVVAYDATGGCHAARMWWMLRWIGHTRVAVLDGGWDAWTSAGMAVASDLPSVEPATYTPVGKTVAAVDAAFVSAHLADPTTLVIDARGADRFRGENETIDPVAGHIPGATNRFFKLNLGEDGRFKTPEELCQDFTAIIGGRPPEAAVHQCGSGVTACHNLLAMEHAGLTGSRLYVGSWSDWISDPTRPVAR